MRRPNRRVLPTVIGVTALTTLAANGAVVLAMQEPPVPTTQQSDSGQYVAAANSAKIAPVAVAPLSRRQTPHVLIAAAGTLPAEVLAKVKRTKGVRAVEVVDAAQTMIAGKRVGLLGVEPSTFRSYTPKPTAESDSLWSNVAGGDLAISFTMGSDGGVQLGSQVPVGGQQPTTRRVGAYATMGIGDVDAVVSRSTARSLNMPAGNALLVSAPKTDLGDLRKKLRKVLPKGTKAVQVSREIDYPSAGRLPAASGKVMDSRQVQTVIRAAQTRIGWPYVWGGESEAEGGYDCSGLMQYAFARAGIRLPRVAADQARTGWVIPFKQAKPGDMLIWANDPTAPGYISHIALYIGGGKMIAAPRRGTRVQIQNVYFGNFKGAIRVNPQHAAKIAG